MSITKRTVYACDVCGGQTEDLHEWLTLVRDSGPVRHFCCGPCLAAWADTI